MNQSFVDTVDLGFVASTREIDALMDPGPEECTLLKVTHVIHVNDKHSYQLEEIFPFAIELMPKVRLLSALIEQFLETTTQQKSGCVLPSVAKWIFLTNKIESAGVETEEETFELLKTGKYKQHTMGEIDVLRTFQLLQDERTYKPCSIGVPSSGMTCYLQERTFDPETLKKWHATLFKDVGYDVAQYHAGTFRHKGAAASAPNEHVYPHHKIINTSIKQLGELVYKLAKRIQLEKGKDRDSLVLYTTCLAAFAQFHFVDIHPFSDGNGRICRFISKHIMDHVSPLPVPMFHDRKRYIESLVKGRQSSDPMHMPKQLTELLLDEALYFYQEVNKTLNLPTLFCALTSEELLEQARQERLSELEQHQLEVLFKALRDDSSAYFNIGERRVRIKKPSTLSFDEMLADL